MNNLIGKWGGTYLYILSCNEKNDIYPKDWCLLNNYQYIRSLHLCIDVEKEYLTLTFDNNIRIRVKPNIFLPLDIVPLHKPLENVKYYNSKGIIEFGIIKGIHWHNNDRKFYYNIEVNGKMKGRKYYDEDLEKVE
jgi:hypothetical protein